jgi:hypothetical protein
VCCSWSENGSRLCAIFTLPNEIRATISSMRTWHSVSCCFNIHAMIICHFISSRLIFYVMVEQIPRILSRCLVSWCTCLPIWFTSIRFFFPSHVPGPRSILIKKSIMTLPYNASASSLVDYFNDLNCLLAPAFSVMLIPSTHGDYFRVLNTR